MDKGRVNPPRVAGLAPWGNLVRSIAHQDDPDQCYAVPTYSRDAPFSTPIFVYFSHWDPNSVSDDSCVTWGQLPIFYDTLVHRVGHQNLYAFLQELGRFRAPGTALWIVDPPSSRSKMLAKFDMYWALGTILPRALGVQHVLT